MDGKGMDGKGYIIAVLFIAIGSITLSLNCFIHLDYFLAMVICFAFIFLLGGFTILNRHIVRIYAVQETKLHDDFELLKNETQFYILEFAKVVTVFLLGSVYPLEAFFVFLFMDCVDGWWLPYEKRSLTLRHRIDKFTDFLCQIMFFIVALQLWSSFAYLWTILFILTVLKSVAFLKTGNRNHLIYIPNIFLVMYPITLMMERFFPFYFTLTFSSLYYTILYIAIMLTIAALYEAFYNGLLSSFRYRIRRRVDQI